MSPASRTPDWLLERIALGELPPAELAAAKARLEREPDGLERLARLEADTEATLERHAPARVVAEVERRRRLQAVRDDVATERRSGPMRRVWPALSLGVPLAASLAVLFVVSHREPREEPSALSLLPESTRIKGDPRLTLQRQGAAGPERLKDASPARRGDVLQLAYHAGGHRYGAVLSLDGRGAVTLHLPESATGSTELQGGPVSLPHAYELDDAPAFERFVLVTSDAPVDVESVLESARTLARDPSQARHAPLALPPSLNQTSVTVEKVP